MGRRVFTESAMLPMPVPRHSAVMAEPVCSTDAPNACMAWITSAMVPPKPTMVAMSAEDQECSGASRVSMGVRVP
jgi:hypothetical protein